MQVVHQPSELSRHPRGFCVALGMFDGVHLGHQHVIRTALIEAARLGALCVAATFDPHPLAVVNPDRAPRLLQTLPQRLRALAALGCEAALVNRFTPELAAKTGEQFLRELAGAGTALRSVSVGEGFHFGRHRSGNVPLLTRLGGELDFTVRVAEAVSIGGEVVSSSRIREALRAGEFSQAAELLGRPYALAGVVERGAQLGAKLGFPTANIPVTGLELPPFGVYAAHVRPVDSGESWPAVVNLGSRPTLTGGAATPRLEAHLFGFDGELYGRELEVELARHLRPERRFESLATLQAQISQDASAARKLLLC